jgi:acetolactate synthase-1/2/3 large subunit
MLGMHGTVYANYAIAECDVLVAAGARFDDRVTGKCDCFAENATIIQIDIDPAEVGKNVQVDIPIVGDVKHILSSILVLCSRQQQTEWLEKIHQWKNDYPLVYKTGGKLKPQMVIEKFFEATKGDAIVTTEVGQHQMWAAQFYRFKSPRSFVSSGGLGTMGYGLPATVGAQIGCPERTVVNISGDGSFQMNVQELATAVRYKLPIKIAILNNQYLGMVRQWQEMFFDRRYACTDISDQPDFVKLAEAYGAVGIRVTEENQVEAAIKEAMSITDRPVVMDFRVDPDENVFPMIPSGGTVEDIILT